MKHQLDKNRFQSAILVDLSKAFDTIKYDLSIVKLHEYGFRKKALDIVQNYFKNRKQWLKINMNFITWTDLISGVPQGSAVVPLVFNICLNDLFFFLQDKHL